MRVLRILLDSQLQPLAHSFVDYLVDAGHNVYLIVPLDKLNEWQKLYHHSITYITGLSSLPDVDYVVDFDGTFKETDITRISFSLEVKKNQIQVTSWLKNKNDSFLLTNSSSLLSFPTSEEIIINDLTEVLIDTIVILSRFDYPQGNLLATTPKYLNRFQDLVDYFKRAKDVEHYNSALKNHDDLYNGQDLCHFALDLSSTKSIDIKANWLDSYEIQILTLALMVLFNGRQEGVYVFDYSQNISSSTVPMKKITKFIEVHFDDNYNTLIKKLKKPYSLIFNNLFYSSNIVEKNIIVSVCYGSSSEQSYPFALTYDKACGVLQMLGNKDWLESTEILSSLDILLKNLTFFREKHQTFLEFLQIDAINHTQLLIQSNNTAQVLPEKARFPQFFEEQVKRTPNKIAVRIDDQVLTYTDLNQAANQLAYFLRLHSPASSLFFAALYMERSLFMPISLLAVMKAGGVYIPLDLRYPEDRIEAIIRDSQPKFILTTENYAAKLEEFINKINMPKDNAPTILSINKQSIQNKLSTYSKDNSSDLQLTNEDLAYVIYTSGTTGMPKGVMIEHQSLMNLLISVGEHVYFNKNDRLLSVTTIAFDIAALEFFLPLLKGGELIIAKESDVVNPQKLISLIKEYQVSIMQATPSLWSVIMQALQDQKLNIRILCGGEDLPHPLAKSLLQHANQVWNVYGPTETTIWSTIKELKIDMPYVTMGRPLANTSLYVLDSRGAKLPAGAVGELHIGGVGLARGYLNKPELTTKQFVPYSSKSGDYFRNEKIYKTGDLVRQFSNGDIQYVSRKDFQVKINGFRMELGEIENALTGFPGVKEAVVIVKSDLQKLENGEITKHLVAYYVAELPLSEQEIMRYMQQKLPEYMIPSFFVHVHKMPLSVNGKIDRKALPAPNFQTQLNLRPPRNELEERLWFIWSEILGLVKSAPDINSDFFNCGGNSILAIRLVNKINSEIQADIKISDIFQFRTIEALSPLVQETIGRFLYEDFVIQGIDREHLFDPYPLNNVQQAYALGRFNNFELSSVSTHIYTEYVFGVLDIDRLEKAFNRLLQRHLALRTVFNQNLQYYLKEYPYYNIRIIDCTDEKSINKIRDELSHKLYDIELYPLFDIVVSRFKDKYILHISFDALIVDMGSFQILFDEWIKLYNNLSVSLSELNVTHRDYALQYDHVRKSSLFKKAEQYWEKKIENYNFDVNLPLSTYPSTIDTPRFARITKTIPHTIWQKVVQKAQQRHISPTAIVLEAYGHVLSYWTGQDKLCINLTLFNRLPLHSQISDIIGDFTVLELFDYQSQGINSTITSELQRTHRTLLLDIENNLFDGIDFQRLVRKKRTINTNQILAPIVLTSVLGNISQGKSIFDLPLNETYQGVNYAISQTPQVWLDNKAYETAEGFVAEWDYVEQLFDQDVITSMHASYCDFIQKLADVNWDKQPLPKLSFPSVELIHLGNSITQEVSEDTLFGRYDKAYEKVKNQVAIVDSKTELEYTHQELWYESELFARYLVQFTRQHKLTSHKLIAVLSQKGYNQVVTTLAIMKAGYAYLPLNIDWPVGRLEDVMEQGKCEILFVSKQEMKEKAISQYMQGKHILVIEDVLHSLRSLDQQSSLATVSLPNVHADDMAYVIFTSGSTGKPKGVTISHRGALNTIDAVNRRFQVTSKDRILALSELSFDLSVYDIFGLLAAGGAIVFPKQEEVKHPKHWLDLVQKYKITLWNTVPQLASLFIDEAEEHKSAVSSLRVFLLSGDWIPLTLPPRIQQLCLKATVMSLGGATEGSIWSIWYEIKDVHPHWASIPYGVAMPNQKMYVLNHHNDHCPVDVIGEIHIGGMGVALDYWGDNKLTEEKFIEHPELGRLYKTGDLGKWNKDGQIEFLGRKDFQVKIRGYRVELGEIESALSQLPEIDKVALHLQRDNGLDHLIAYLVPKHKKESDTDKEAFKLEQCGLLKVQDNFTQISPSLDENKYRFRKSYRRFLDENLAKDTLERAVQNAIRLKKLKVVHPYNTLTKESLANILAVISGLNLKDKALPKYRYPSAGSSYGVRCFATIHNDISDLHSGSYYYHPTRYGLFAMTSSFDQVTAGCDATCELHLVIHWPAIRPLYGDFSRKLALIEAGHMLSLLTDALEAENIGYTTIIANQDLDCENTHVLTVTIGGQKQQKPQTEFTIDLLYREGSIYQTKNKDSFFNIDKLDIFIQADVLGSLLRSGKAMLTIAAEPSPLNYISSGMAFQKISEALNPLNIGSCVLGFAPFEDALYSMVVGNIPEQDKFEWETKVEPLSLSDVINAKISHVLPDYMIPSDYVLIDRLPLNANGKLDLSQLPKFEVHSQHIAPKTTDEIKVARIWSEILGISLDKISITDRFFQLGGNSLSAMQAVRRLNKDLGIEIKLNDLYKHNTIQLFLSHFCTSTISAIREEGIL